MAVHHGGKVGKAGKTLASNSSSNQYNQVEFEVIVLLERTPFEMLLGVIGHNFSFVLNLNKGYELEKLSDEIFYRLCNILIFL